MRSSGCSIRQHPLPRLLRLFRHVPDQRMSSFIKIELLGVEWERRGVLLSITTAPRHYPVRRFRAPSDAALLSSIMDASIDGDSGVPPDPRLDRCCRSARASCLHQRLARHAEIRAALIGIHGHFLGQCSTSSRPNYVPKPDPSCYRPSARATHSCPRAASCFEDLPRNLVPAHARA